MTYSFNKKLINKYNYDFQGDNLIALAKMIIVGRKILQQNKCEELLEISKKYDKSFKLVFRNGSFELKILNKELYDDPKFRNIIIFLDKNNINVGQPIINTKNVTELD